MESGSDSHRRLARLRWRLRGALQWPAFALALVADALLLHLLPVAGNGTPFGAAVLLALFVNLVAVAVLAPLAALPIRARRPDLPRIVARDYAGTALVAAVTVLVAAFGVAHHGSVQAHDRSFHQVSDAVRAFVAGHAPAAYRDRVDRTDVLQLDAALYRACVPSAPGTGSPARYWCMLVDAAATPPHVRFDPSGAPNTSFGHPLG